MAEFNEIIDSIKKSLSHTNDVTSEEICAKMKELLGVEGDYTTKQVENMACNYIWLHNLVEQDLNSIDDTLKKLQEMENSTPKPNEYTLRKIRYFSKINSEAKSEIEEFTHNGLLKKVREKPDSVWWKDNANNDVSIKFRYDYSLFKQYYDIDYDFDTEVMLDWLPLEYTEKQTKIKQYQNLRKTDNRAFYSKINKLISDENIVERIHQKVKFDYFLNKRVEIFDTLLLLYRDKKYQSYISLSVIEIEGILDDCVKIINNVNIQGTNAGTLVEKSSKVFDEYIKKLALYPYFAFALPILRNEVAHVGMPLSTDLDMLADEITLVLFTTVKWANKYSQDKYYSIIMSYDEYIKDHLPSTLFIEFHLNLLLSDKKAIDVLANPEKYSEEIQFYRESNSDKDAITILEMIDVVSSVMKSEAFWRHILDDELNDLEGQDTTSVFSVCGYVRKLRDAFIPVLPKDSQAKILCQEVSRILKEKGL